MKAKEHLNVFSKQMFVSLSRKVEKLKTFVPFHVQISRCFNYLIDRELGCLAKKPTYHDDVPYKQTIPFSSRKLILYVPLHKQTNKVKEKFL